MSNKPSWDDAPEWAERLAINAMGRWYWHELEPEANMKTGTWMSNGRQEYTGLKIPEIDQEFWYKSLERRP